ncbi:hypothetical protein PFICI_01941 [Pestalotiopsis fici W106-1]|uniref:NAD(P)-binding domain-containing protein n=1 Tax=Pestalotiopsis fici (strain W106-1 / CGMCC3.15140) TaxID=1229662 RepID=W3XPY2_PESFW|nr:uncharacterized protein PFICI_01941 [Pestalotiopsis fici W106-1]ETS88113.1 hypothetical protein PFICI_01941 [Pestalotiopsis fici W106-1]
MKLVIGGSTGFVGTELVRQALLNKDVDSVVGLSRRETPAPVDLDKGRLKSVVCDDFTTYPDAVKEELRDVDACIWTIAVTPSKLQTVPHDEAIRISCDYAITALQTLASLRQSSGGEGNGKPLRFILMTGHFTPRTPAEVHPLLKERGMSEYGLARGASEVKTLAFAQQSGATVEAAVAKPGMIVAPGVERRNVPGIPEVALRDVAAALLDQVVNGLEKDTLSNDDLVRIGQKVLAGP